MLSQSFHLNAIKDFFFFFCIFRDIKPENLLLDGQGKKSVIFYALLFFLIFIGRFIFRLEYIVDFKKMKLYKD